MLVQRLARQVQALHQNGRIHRAIGIDAVTVDEQLRPQLPPPAGAAALRRRRFRPGVLPAGTDRRRRRQPARGDRFRRRGALQEAGYTLDPRRIDVYQLGVLLCRLVTGEPVLSYIYDATIKARVPAVARPLLERTLGLRLAGAVRELRRADRGVGRSVAEDRTVRRRPPRRTKRRPRAA